MRRRRAEKREGQPDTIYNNEIVGKFINSIMHEGKKYLAEQIFYDALKIVETKTSKPGLSVFLEAVSNVKPDLEVKPRRVGGATYQVPMEVRAGRKLALTIRWLLQGTREKKGMPMSAKLAEELNLAADKKGTAYKKKEDTHRMAEANKAFAHFRW